MMAIRTVLGIEGMACQMCEAHVNEAIRKGFDVASVKSNRKKRQCVIVSEQELDRDRIADVVANTGYELTSIASEPYQRKRFGLFG